MRIIVSDIIFNIYSESLLSLTSRGRFVYFGVCSAISDPGKRSTDLLTQQFSYLLTLSFPGFPTKATMVSSIRNIENNSVNEY